jgi:hypothetical protein
MNLEPNSAKWATRMLTAVLSGFVGMLIVFVLVDTEQQDYVQPIGALISVLSVFASYPIYDKLYVYCQRPTKKSKSSADTIKLSSYSLELFGRYPSDGNADGQTFRNNILIPALKNCEVVVVELDVRDCINSSFIDEAFAGLIRHCNFSFEDLNQRIEFIAKDSDWIDEIKWYMKEAEEHQASKE